MNTAILLCSVVLASDSPANVHAMVVSGMSSDHEQSADLEPWVGQAAARFGSPRVLRRGPWQALTGEFQNLAPRQSGMPIQGKATGRNGSYMVEITACAGAPLGGTVTLKPGERRIMKLTLDAAPNNVFVALKAPVSTKATRRATAMKANISDFRLDVNYIGEQDKPFYQLIVSVPTIIRRRSSPFERIIQVEEKAAIAIIDHLAREGFFDRAADPQVDATTRAPTVPGYVMTATAGPEQWYVNLGWGLPMIHQLDALRAVIPDHGQTDLDRVLERLSGWRRQWENEHPPFVASARRDDTRIEFSKAGATTVIDVTSKTGIDTAIIKRESPKWAASMLVRLRLSGLELFNVGNGELSVDWTVGSTGDHLSSVFLRSGIDEKKLDAASPYYSVARVVGGERKIPLTRGYFEVPLPPKLFERNPEEITLQWIDFYRN